MNLLPPTLRQRRVFVDSSAFLALLDKDDPHHTQAESILAWIADHRFRQVTTNIIVIESQALVLSALGNNQARRFLEHVANSDIVVVRASFRDEEHAQAILFKYTDKDFSFADAISFTVMERLHISLAFAFDRHFAQYGLTIVTPEQP